MEILRLKNIGKRFSGSASWAVKEFSLTVEKSEIVAFLGESGCGKTTLLRMIAGFETPTEGSIYLKGQKVAGNGVFMEPQKRKVGIVFQDYALFPHKTVWENITYGLSQYSKNEASLRAGEIISVTGLEGLEKRFPHQLSGGQKQRVALARAMAPEPEIILFDEPFSNLDSIRKNQMRDDIRDIIKKNKATAIFVTHDTKDVLAIADKVSVLRNGSNLQTDSPEKVYFFPVNRYVADFFGKTNIVKAKVTSNGLITPIGNFTSTSKELKLNEEVFLTLRPEQLQISTKKPGCICGEIVNERFLGEYKEITLNINDPNNKESEIILYASPQHPCIDKKCYFKPREGEVNIIRNTKE
jgi:iron(III) transport system ATP-binding protein